MAKKKVTDYVHEWMEDFGKTEGYELSRVEFLKESDVWYLRVFVEKISTEGYVPMGTDDCEHVSHYLSEKLDETDPVKQNYYLEVSSPGLDRLLITDKDFERFTGEIVDIKLFHPLNGEKALQGKLISLQEGIITIADTNNKETAVPIEQASKVSLAVIF